MRKEADGERTGQAEFDSGGATPPRRPQCQDKWNHNEYYNADGSALDGPDVLPGSRCDEEEESDKGPRAKTIKDEP